MYKMFSGGGKTMKCPYCDFENKPTSKFCENCGARLIPDESKTEQNHAYDGVSQEPYTDAENVFSGAADDDGYDGTNQYGGQEPPFRNLRSNRPAMMEPISTADRNLRSNRPAMMEPISTADRNLRFNRPAMVEPISTADRSLRINRRT